MAFWSKKTPNGTDPTAAPVAPPVSPPAKPAIAAPPPPSPAAPVQTPQKTPSSPAAPQSAPQPELSPEARKKAIDASKHLMMAFGQITNVLMRSAQYKQHTLADLEWLVVPAVMSGQFAIVEAQLKSSGMMAPVGVLLWARVSAEVDKRLLDSAAETPLRLKQEDWRSGDILWVIGAVGEPEMVQAMLKRKMESDWKDRPVKMRARDKAGNVRVGTLTGGTPPAPAV